MADGQHRAVEIGRYAEPILAVIGGDRAIVLPSRRIGGAAGIHDRQRAIARARPGEAKIEPLIEIGIAVPGDLEPDVTGLGAGHTGDLAAVEIAADPHGSRSSKRCRGAVCRDR